MPRSAIIDPTAAYRCMHLTIAPAPLAPPLDFRPGRPQVTWADEPSA